MHFSKFYKGIVDTYHHYWVVTLRWLFLIYIFLKTTTRNNAKVKVQNVLV